VKLGSKPFHEICKPVLPELPPIVRLLWLSLLWLTAQLPFRAFLILQLPLVLCLGRRSLRGG